MRADVALLQMSLERPAPLQQKALVEGRQEANPFRQAVMDRIKGTKKADEQVEVWDSGVFLMLTWSIRRSSRVRLQVNLTQ